MPQTGNYAPTWPTTAFALAGMLQCDVNCNPFHGGEGVAICNFLAGRLIGVCWPWCRLPLLPICRVLSHGLYTKLGEMVMKDAIQVDERKQLEPKAVNILLDYFL